MNPATLPGAIAMGEPVVAYSGRAARVLDSVPAAVLISQLWYLTGGGRTVTDETMDQLHHSTGLSPKQQRNARKLLVTHGWLGEERVRSNGRTRILTRVHAQTILTHIHAATAGIDAALAPPTQTEPGRVPKGNTGPGAQREPSKKELPCMSKTTSEVSLTLEVSKKKEAENSESILVPGTHREYRVDAGSFDLQSTLAAVAALDAQQGLPMSAATLDVIVRGLTAIRVGTDKSPAPMPFATYSGADCALVRRKLRTMRPSELIKAVLGATHIDTWARERGLSLAQILGRADHYAATFDSRKQKPDRERAASAFLEAYQHASKLAVPEADEWGRVRERMSFLSVAELADWTRQMVERVNTLRARRGQGAMEISHVR